MADNNGKPIVEMRGVVKRFGDLEVLKDFNIDIPRGQKMVLIGPSGSGKSTILRILMTLEEVTDGDVYLNGENLFKMEKNGQSVPADENHLHRLRGKVGMVFQHFNLFPHMTVLRNVTEAPVHVLGMAKAKAEELARKLLDDVGLADKAESYPSQLSGGQKQRVAIARALAMEPQIMLFDEITSALDPELVGEVLSVLRRLARETDITMLIVTHQTSFAAEIADRVVFMDGGVVVEDDTPQEILNNPKNERTQEFLKNVLTN